MQLINKYTFNSQNVVLFSTIVVLFGMIVLPLGFLLFASFWSDPAWASGGYFTFNNFIQAFGKIKGWIAIRNSLILGVVVTSIVVPCGFGFAWIIQRTNTPGRTLLGQLMIVPLFVSPLLLCLAYIALMNPSNGFINLLLRKCLYLQGQGPLNIYTFSGIVFLLVIHFIPYAYLNIFGALRNLDASMEEAARIAGASELRRFLNFIVPILTPAMASAGLIVFVLAIEQFTTVTLLGAMARFPSMPQTIYYAVTYDPPDPNFAAALGVILLAISGVGMYFYRRMARKAFKFVTVTGKYRLTQVRDLGKLKYATLGVCVLYIIMAVVLPYMAIALASFMNYITTNITWSSFTLKNYADLFAGQGADNVKAIINTLFLAFLAASTTVIVALLMAYVVQRLRTRGRWLIDYLCMIPMSIPGLSLALGMLWTYLYLPIPIYGTIWVLFLAYVTKFLSHGYRITSSGLIQIGSELEEAAKMSGASTLRALRQIIAPILFPSLISGWILIFILAALEISVTIILFTSESITMSVAIWNQTAQGQTVIAYALALILGGIGLLVLLIAQKVFGILRYT